MYDAGRLLGGFLIFHWLAALQGKRKMVDGFVRWCKRGNAGLNQVTKVKEVIDESPTGLYDGFYVRTH